MDKQII